MCRQVRDRLELLSRLDTLAFSSESARTRIVASDARYRSRCAIASRRSTRAWTSKKYLHALFGPMYRSSLYSVNTMPAAFDD